MRIYLTLFLLSAVALTGCAEDLVGPTIETSGVTAPVVTAPDFGSLYASWEATDASGEHQFAFRQGPVGLPEAADGGPEVRIAGAGAFTPAKGGKRGPLERLAFGIDGYVDADRQVTFNLVSGGVVIGTAEGQANAAYTELVLEVSLSDREAYSVTLAPAEVIPPVEEDTSLP
ncbi:MAG: hypothetical protein AAGI91_14290 [Bacteroidota bacterium]